MFLMSQLLRDWNSDLENVLNVLPYFLTGGIKERAFTPPTRETILGDLYKQGLTISPTTGEVMSPSDVEFGISRLLNDEMERYPKFVTMMRTRYSPLLKSRPISNFLKNSYMNSNTQGVLYGA